MAYVFQNLDGDAKRAVESLGVTVHSCPTALKTMKRQFNGNPNSLGTAYMNDMLNSSYVSSNDRHALRHLEFSSLRLNPLATITESSPDDPSNSRDLSDSKQDQSQSLNKERRRKSHQAKSVSFESTNTLLSCVLSLSLGEQGAE